MIYIEYMYNKIYMSLSLVLGNIWSLTPIPDTELLNPSGFPGW